MGWECNAVFKGGGAKGIAYVGALEACERWDVEFKEVAGSSAGAITATLVACGYSAQQTIGLMPAALQAIDNVPRSIAKVGIRASLLSSRTLHDWISKAVSDAIVPKLETTDQPVVDATACTFEELRRATGVSLYVVTLDLATRQPLVFCPKLTPDSPVAPAVVASSAIPVAFPSSRMMVDDEVHRLVDGGTWSNYPSFVFLDKDFRDHHDLDESDRPTIGFILDPDAPEPEKPTKSPQPQPGAALISDRGSSASELKLAGAVMSSTLFRWTVGVMPLLFVLLSFAWLRQQLHSEDAIVASVDQRYQDTLIVASIAVLGITGVMAVGAAFLILRLGRSLFDTGIVGASAAMGVGPGVPYWVGKRAGSSDEHVAVRIKVPAALTTLKFDASADVQKAARDRGHDATVSALQPIFGAPVRERGAKSTEFKPWGDWKPAKNAESRVFSGPTDLLGWILDKLIFRPVAWIVRQASSRWYVRLIALVYALIAGTTAAFGVIRGMAAGEVSLVTVGWIVLVATAVAVTLFLLTSMRMREAKYEDPYPLLAKLGRPRLLNVFAALAMFFAISFAVAPLDAADVSYYSALRAQPLSGTVRAVEGQPDDDFETVLDVTVEVPAIQEIDNAEDTYDEILVNVAERRSGSSVEGVDVAQFADLAGADVEVAAFTADASASGARAGASIFVAGTSLSRFEVGEEVIVNIDLDRSLVYFERDLDVDSTAQISLKIRLVATLAFFVVAFRTRRAARWVAENRRTRRSKVDETASAPLPPPVAV